MLPLAIIIPKSSHVCSSAKDKKTVRSSFVLSSGKMKIKTFFVLQNQSFPHSRPV
jgi:hypothetical protein